MGRHVCEPIRDMKTVKEMMEVLRIRRNGFRDAMLFELGFSTALRISDLLQLRKKDIQNGIVRIKTKKTGHHRNHSLWEWKVGWIHLGDISKMKEKVKIQSKDMFNRFPYMV